MAPSTTHEQTPEEWARAVVAALAPYGVSDSCLSVADGEYRVRGPWDEPQNPTEGWLWRELARARHGKTASRHKVRLPGSPAAVAKPWDAPIVRVRPARDGSVCTWGVSRDAMKRIRELAMEHLAG